MSTYVYWIVEILNAVDFLSNRQIQIQANCTFCLIPKPLSHYYNSLPLHTGPVFNIFYNQVIHIELFLYIEIAFRPTNNKC